MCILYGGGLVLLSQKQKLAFVSGVFYMATYAVQIIGIFLVIRLSQWIAMDSIVMSYGFLIMKVLLIIIITAGLRFLVKKRGVSDRKNLKVKGMMLVPIISFALIFYIWGQEKSFCEIRI